VNRNFGILNASAFRENAGTGIAVRDGESWENLALVDFEVMQFTGLTDKNEKEIYEGDIVRDTLKNKQAKPLTVEWRDYCFCIKEIPNLVWLGASHEFYEVIGNIYENTELLKKAL
jgi:hypothetical protein